MSKVKKIAQYLLSFGFLTYLVVLALSFLSEYGYIPDMEWLKVENTIWYLPGFHGVATVTGVTVFFIDESILWISAFGIPLFCLFGCVMKNKAVWIYRILVYSTLAFSLFCSVVPIVNSIEYIMYPTSSSGILYWANAMEYVLCAVSAGWFVLAILADVLPE